MRCSKFIFLFFTSALFLFQSCSVEKRHYLGGYFFQHKNRHPVTANPIVTSNKRSVPKKTDGNSSNISDQKVNKDLIASSAGKKEILTDLHEIILPLSLDTCDTIVLRNDIQIKARVIEITPKIIRYRHCDNPNGPTYNIPVKDVLLIKYKNGTRDEFKSEGPTEVERQLDQAKNEKIRRKANISLIFGILAFPLTLFYIVGIIFAILAITNGRSVLRIIDSDTSPYASTHKAIARVGIILGIVYLALLVLLVLAIIGSFAAFLFLI